MASPGDLNRNVALRALAALLEKGHVICVAPQNYYEYWVVATRPPARNGLGLPISQVVGDIEKFDSDFELLTDTPETLGAWRALVTKYSVSGKPAHDVRLVASMIRHGVTHLLTFNAADFARFAEIAAIAPGNVATLPQQST